MAQTKYLRKTGTDTVYIWTPYLSIRDDMEPYDGPVPIPKNGTTAEILPTVGIAAPVVEIVEQVQQSPIADSDMVSANKQILILEAIAKLEQSDYTTTGYPKVDALEKILGFTVTSQERNAAWQEYVKEHQELEI